MKPKNQKILNSMFGCTLKEARKGLAQRNKRLIISKLVNKEHGRHTI